MWSQRQALYAHYLQAGLSVDALLAMGWWSGGAQREYDNFYWAPRFMVTVPVGLIDLLFPFLPAVRASATRLGKLVSPSVWPVIRFFE